VLLNTWRAYHRRKKPDLIGPDGLAHFAAEDEPEPPAEAEERRQLLQRALARIRPRFEPASWRAFDEHVLRGRPAAEVGAEVGLTVNAVYIVKSRVLRELRRELRGLVD
jgi:RNA polymerase sigma-70 factor (ECF subfamily)